MLSKTATEARSTAELLLMLILYIVRKKEEHVILLLVFFLFDGGSCAWAAAHNHLNTLRQDINPRNEKI